MAEAEGRRFLIVAFIVAALAGVALLVLPRLSSSRAEAPADAIGKTGRLLPGNVTQQRSKIDPGKSDKAVLDAIGKPSVAVETKGAERHTIWTYYYADGNLTLNMTDGYLVRVDTEYGPSTRGLDKR